MTKIRTDVLIIGGGPAGAACALRLKKKGVDCVILDKQPFPRFKPCAGWITPGLFRDLDMEPADYTGGLTTFRSFVVSVRGFRFRLPVKQYAIRRYEFDEWLLQRADVPFYVHTVKTIERAGDGYEIDGTYFGKYLIGAGGTHCPVYQALFKSISPRFPEALIVAQEEEFPYPVTDERCHLWFFDRGFPGYAWYVPKAGGYLNVGIGGKAAALKAGGETLRSHWMHLIQKLDALGLVRDHAFKPGGHYYYLRQKQGRVRTDNAFLVGDAAALATPDMGEGIRPAIQSGLLAAEAIIQGGEYSPASIPEYSWPSLLGF
jgi:flavin-dependent dehydrogenase